MRRGVVEWRIPIALQGRNTPLLVDVDVDVDMDAGVPGCDKAPDVEAWRRDEKGKSQDISRAGNYHLAAAYQEKRGDLHSGTIRMQDAGCRTIYEAAGSRCE
ncbi:hypothetical protein HYFRA_00012083 [Hymenoscyphus fraxineus]|uniref:Uncharacterized protein n=1 Tax=Hymenoscyphus fraxineus TaxID=746836 RepID=A0A9N9PQU7_9HELO|nr:hypothetical protein HYFRA_00012083 [Hymenoscyphus fraxineus]